MCLHAFICQCLITLLGIAITRVVGADCTRAPTYTFLSQRIEARLGGIQSVGSTLLREFDLLLEGESKTGGADNADAKEEEQEAVSRVSRGV